STNAPLPLIVAVTPVLEVAALIAARSEPVPSCAVTVAPAIAVPLMYNWLVVVVPATIPSAADTIFGCATAVTVDLLWTLLMAAALAMAPDWPLKLLIALVSFPAPTWLVVSPMSEAKSEASDAPVVL